MSFLSFSLQSPFLTESHRPSRLPRITSNTALVSGCVVGTVQTLIWSYSCVFLPPKSTVIRASVFSLCPFIYSINTVSA